MNLDNFIGKNVLKLYLLLLFISLIVSFFFFRSPFSPPEKISYQSPFRYPGDKVNLTSTVGFGLPLAIPFLFTNGGELVGDTQVPFEFWVDINYFNLIFDLVFWYLIAILISLFYNRVAKNK